MDIFEALWMKTKSKSERDSYQQLHLCVIALFDGEGVRLSLALAAGDNEKQ